MPITLTTYDNVVATQGNPPCFDGTSLWMGLIFLSTLEIQKQDPADGSILNSYNITVSNSQDTRPPSIAFAGAIWFGGGGLTTSNSNAQNLLYKVSPAGALLGTFNITGQSDVLGGLNPPQTTQGVATDGTQLYLAATYNDTGNNQVSALTAYNAAGAIQWSKKLNTFRITPPTIDGNGNIWIADVGGGTLYQYDAAGTLLQTVPEPGVSPNWIQYANGSIWIVDANNNALIQVNATTGATITNTPIGGGHYFPYSLQADAANNLWVICQDSTAAAPYHMVVFNDSGTQLTDFVFPDSGGIITSFAIENQMVFVNGQMFATGVNGTTGNPTLFAMTLTLAPASGVFIGTFAGFITAGFFGGGTK